MNNLEIYNEIFQDVFSVDQTQLNENFTKEKVADWDSIHQLNLLTGIEDAFDIILGTVDAISITSYELGKEILTSKYNIEFI